MHDAQSARTLLPGPAGPPNASWYSRTFELQCTPATCPVIATEAWARLQDLVSAKVDAKHGRQQSRSAGGGAHNGSRIELRLATVVDVIGERESGTNFGLALVQANSPTQAQPSTQVAGWKHAIGDGSNMCDGLRGTDSLVIVMFRNALDWSRGFFTHPWHCRYHCALPTIYDFVTLEFGPAAGPPGQGQKCDNHEVEFEDYYWQKDGRYAANLMEARAWWAQSWLAAAEACPENVVPVRYEQLIGHEGTGFIDIFQRLNQRSRGPSAPALELSDAFPQMVSEYKGKGQVLDVSALYSASAYMRRRNGDTAALDEMGLDHRTIDAILQRIDHRIEEKLGYRYNVDSPHLFE